MPPAVIVEVVCADPTQNSNNDSQIMTSIQSMADAENAITPGSAVAVTSEEWVTVNTLLNSMLVGAASHFTQPSGNLVSDNLGPAETGLAGVYVDTSATDEAGWMTPDLYALANVPELLLGPVRTVRIYVVPAEGGVWTPPVTISGGVVSIDGEPMDGSGGGGGGGGGASRVWMPAARRRRRR